MLDERLAVEGRGLEDLVFRAGLATRNDYIPCVPVYPCLVTFPISATQQIFLTL